MVSCHAPGCINQADKNSNIMTLVTITNNVIIATLVTITNNVVIAILQHIQHPGIFNA